MPQLGPLADTLMDVLSNLVVGASINVYREGATISGNQAGTSPLTLNIRHPGKILTGDTVFLENDNSTTYTVTAVTLTTMQITGFTGTLSVLNSQRIVPSNNQPTIYSDDQGGATVAQPLTSDAFGSIAVSGGSSPLWMEGGAYHILAAAAGATARLYQTEVIVPEAPGVVYSGERDGNTAVAHIEDTRFALTVAGAKLKSGRNLGVEKYSIDKDGTGIFPRIGPLSSPTSGGALRFVDGNQFPLTVAGVQAALDECEAVGGGMVYVPAQAGIQIVSTWPKIGNRVTLVGFGDHGSVATFIAANGVTVATMLENKTQDGTQQFAAAVNISLNGNKGSGAVVTTGLKFVKVYAGSHWRNILVNNISGDACLLDGGSANGLGPVLVELLTVANNGGHNVIVNGACVGVHFYHLDSERPGTGKAALKFTNASAIASSGHAVYGGYIEESDATADGIWLDGVSNCRLDNIFFNGTAAANVVKITGSVGGSDGAFAAGGHVITNLTGNLATIIDDQVAGVTLGNAQGRFVREYRSPVASATLDKSQCIGVQSQRQGVDITAATTISPDDGNLFFIVGNTNIDNISNAARYKGKVVHFKTSGTPSFKHLSGGTGNIRCSGSVDLVMAADRRVSFFSDGTLWWQATPVVSA